MLLDEPLENLSLVAFDLEATGPAPGFDHIIEVGAARFRIDPHGVVLPGPTFEQLVRPGRSIPPTTASLTGLDDSTVGPAPPLERVLPELTAFLAASDGRPTVMLAHMARVDLALLVAETHRVGRTWAGPPFVCTLEIARATLKGAPSYKLSSLVQWLDCAPEPAIFHRALPDALHTRNLLGRCVSRRGARTLAELGAGSVAPVPTPADLEVRLPKRLGELEQATGEGRPIWIVYRSGSKGRDPRKVTPLGWYAFSGRSWLRGWCHVDECVKSFRCDRIARVIVRP